MTDTNKLLLDYAHHGSDSSFRELVDRYVNLVFSVALRRASGNAHLAEDVTQTVFTDLARKARSLPASVMLGGWLHRHTCFVASNLLRSESRRRHREQEAVQMNALNADAGNAWLQLGPVVDEAIDQLEAADREAIVLRYFEQRDLRGVGNALGIGEDAAQKRVSRAVDKLRDLVGSRGATLSATVMVAALASGAVSAAPAGLAAKVSGAALTTAGVGAGIVSGTLAFLAAAKVKLALAAMIVAAIAIPLLIQRAGTTEPNTTVADKSPDNTTNSTALNAATSATSASTNTTPKAKPISKESGLLRLKIVTADSGKPIPNVPIDYRRWDGGKFTGRKFQTPRLGECEVYFSREKTTHLELTTRVDGFADTRLHWLKSRGDEIPEQYTLRLPRSVPIGGTVIDADGKPVTGAKVGFNHDDDPTTVKWPQDQEFSWIEVTTDENGRWRMDRMADEIIPRIYGRARHSLHVDSGLIFLTRDPGAESKLRAEKFMFQLGRPVTATGVVVNVEGTPVADAEVLIGGRSMSNKRTARSHADGSFTVPGCPPGKQLVSAVAKGFAMTTIEATDLGIEPLRLVLQQGKLLRLQIVNQAGEPIPKASVWLDTMRNNSINEPPFIPVQADFNPKSNKEGLVVWNNAPDTELQFSISATGYMRADKFKVRPDSSEHLVTLTSRVLVSGKISDANTGQPIPRFRIVSGWPRMNPDGSTGVNWSSFDRDWATYTGGKYRHSFEDALVYGCPNPGYVLKFEAENYASFTSRVIKPDEGEVQLDVTLTPAATERFTVWLPDGRPAANAEVGLISPGVRLELAPGRFNRQSYPPGGSILKTDKEGRFQLIADASVHTVMIVHPAGFLSLKREELAGKQYLQLQPWGRLEGAVISGGKPAVGKEFSLQFDAINTADVWFGFTSFRVKSDDAGQFVFPQVPPGKLKLVRIVPMPASPGGGGGWSDQPIKDVEVRAGETVQVKIGGQGYTVTARVRWPDGFDRTSVQHFTGAVYTPPPKWFDEIAKDPQHRSTAMQMPEFQEFQRTAKQFQLAPNAEGLLTAEDVTAGEFDLRVFASVQNGQSKTNFSALMGYARITVPTDPPSGTLDAGEIVLSIQKTVPHP